MMYRDRVEEGEENKSQNFGSGAMDGAAISTSNKFKNSAKFAHLFGEGMFPRSIKTEQRLPPTSAFRI
jgi:hypothetical protein